MKKTILLLSVFLPLTMSGCQNSEKNSAVNIDAGENISITSDKKSIFLTANYSGNFPVTNIMWTQIGGEPLAQGERKTIMTNNNGQISKEISIVSNDYTGACEYSTEQYAATCSYSLAMPSDILVPKDYIFRVSATTNKGTVVNDDIRVHVEPTASIQDGSEFMIYANNKVASPGEDVALNVNSTGVIETAYGVKGITYRWELLNSKNYGIPQYFEGDTLKFTVPDSNTINEPVTFFYKITGKTIDGKEKEVILELLVKPVQKDIQINTGFYPTINLNKDTPYFDLTFNGTVKVIGENSNEVNNSSEKVYVFWEFISGESNLIISNPFSIDSAFTTFTKGGLYKFRLYADVKPIRSDNLSNVKWEEFYINVLDERDKQEPFKIIANAGETETLNINSNNSTVNIVLDGSNTKIIKTENTNNAPSDPDLLYYHWEGYKDNADTPVSNILNQNTKTASVKVSEGGDYYFTLYVSEEPILLPIDKSKFSLNKISTVLKKVIDEKTLPRSIVVDSGSAESVGIPNGEATTFYLDGTKTHWSDGYDAEIYYCWSPKNHESDGTTLSNPEEIIIANSKLSTASFSASERGKYVIYLFTKDTPFGNNECKEDMMYDSDNLSLPYSIVTKEIYTQS